MLALLHILVLVHCNYFGNGDDCVDNSVQLVNGSSNSSGRVEICYNSTWGTVCDDSFGLLDGDVVCKQLGFIGALSITNKYGSGTGQIWLDDLDCEGTESTLLNCTRSATNANNACNHSYTISNSACIHNCDHTEDIGVVCINDTGVCEDGSIKLSDTAVDSEGRLDLCVDGIWGSIHSDDFNRHDGRVACGQLGYSSDGTSHHITDANISSGEVVVYRNYFTAFSQRIWHFNPNCLGNESSLYNCSHDSLLSGSVNCTDSRDLRIKCFDDIVLVSNNTTVSLTHHEINETVNFTCIINITYPEIEWTWFFQNKKLESDDHYRITQNQLPNSLASSILQIISLRKSDQGSYQCSVNYIGTVIQANQTHYLELEANCIENTVKLVNGSSNSSGRVEVCYDGTWGTVCDDSFGLIDGDIVCKQLGYIGALSITNKHGSGTGHIWLDDLDCEGTESSVFNCTRRISTTNNTACHQSIINSACIHNCDHTEDIGVVCINNTGMCEDGSIRLSDTTVDSEGRLDLCVDRIWGSVLSDHFNHLDGRVACSQLGYSSDDAIVTSKPVVYYSYFTAFSQRIWDFNPACSGSESGLYNCLHNSPLPGSINCVDPRELRIKCFNNILMISEGSRVLLGPDQIQESINFTCMVNISDPVTDWVWLFDSKKLDETNEHYRITRNVLHNTSASTTLQIFNPRKSDQGRYHCLINYVVSSRIHASQIHILELEAEFLSSSSMENTVSLNCELVGYISNKDVIIEWYKNGNLVETIPDQYYITTTNGNNSKNYRIVNSEGEITQSIISSLHIYTTDVAGDYECIVFGDSDVYANFTLDGNQGDQTTSASTNTVIGSVTGSLIFMIGCIVSIVCIVIIILVHRRNANMKRMEEDQAQRNQLNSRLNLIDADLHNYISMKELSRTNTQKKMMEEKQLSSCAIDPSDVKLMEKVGQGEFGVVYRGVYSATSSVMSVAIKTVRGLYTECQVDELFVEAEKMKSFDHLHVLSLTGVCVGLLESPCIVMPFMSNGSLLSYLRREAADLTINEMADENLFNNLLKQLLSICLQVAKGMDYLSQQKFIHRDLAARNCMISSEGIIKIADFGLAEDIYTTEYFKQDRSSGGESVKLPLKWMALESIHFGKFDEKTDVWSYGVLCWEVFNGGKTPYPGSTPKEVVTMLDNGERLTKPTNAACIEEVYSIMLSCWEKSSKRRPHFIELVESMNKLLVPLADYMDMADFKINA